MKLEDLKKKVQALEDLEEIKKLQRQYMNFIDSQQFDKALELFTDDATAEARNSGVHKGRKGLEKIYLERLPKRRIGTIDGHLVGEPMLSVNGDRAEGHWKVYIFCTKPSVQWVQGRNDCEYVKENGEWKISKLKFTRTLASDPSLYP